MSIVRFRDTGVDINPVQFTTFSATTKGTIIGFNVINKNNYDVWLKIYDETIGDISVGTTVPMYTLQVPKNGSIQEIPNVDNFMGYFTTALTVAATKLVEDSDTTAIGTDSVHVEMSIIQLP